MIVFSFVAVLVLLHPFQRFRRKTQLFEFSFFFPSANLCQLRLWHLCLSQQLMRKQTSKKLDRKSVNEK